MTVSSALGTMVEPLDTKGRFKLGPMPEDQYTVELRCMGCTWEARSIHVGAGEEAHVEFE